jgi:replicative DNA helicase Mcm
MGVMLEEKFDEFFSEYYSDEISQLFLAFPKKRSLEVDVQKLAEFDLELFDNLINKPDETISAAIQALKSFNKNPNLVFQNNLHVRFTGLDASKAPLIQDVGANEIGKFIVVDGLVTKRAEVKPKVCIAAMKCVYCGAYYKVEVTNEPLPQICPECHRKGLKQIDEESNFINLQKAEIQDPLERLRGGSPASHLEIWMEDDLVNTIVPGDRILVHGILRIKPPKSQKTPSKIYSTFLDVVSIKKLQKEFEEIELTPQEEQKIIELSKDPYIFEKISASIAPSIYGYEEIKKAIALQLFGGTPDKVLADGGRVRSDIHILLIGDPGSAKTRLLQYTVSIVPKGIYVSGKSVSSAGLTATAERDELADGGWTLKAGALVLASGGLAAIDEFDKINDEDKAALHEAMESQSISVAKAGIVARLNTRTAILAAANPKFGRFDPSQYPAEQFDIPPTLLSRFDLIFPMIDIMDEERDKKIAEHILKQHSQEYDRKTFSPIDPETLRKYVAYARKNIKPKLTKEAAKVIEEFYISLRKLGKEKGAVPITPRQIEGLVRLAEASAKARLSQKVEVRDAENAINLVNYMLQTLALDRSANRVDIDAITIGLPKSKVEKMNVILQIVKDIESKTKEKEAKIDDVIKEANKKGIDEFLAKKLINDLIEHGDLYTPKYGFVKSVTPEE